MTSNLPINGLGFRVSSRSWSKTKPEWDRLVAQVESGLRAVESVARHRAHAILRTGGNPADIAMVYRCLEPGVEITAA